MCTPVAKFGGLDELLCFQFIQKPLSTLGFRIFFRSIQNQEWKRSFTERPARSVHDLMGRMVSSEKRLVGSYQVISYALEEFGSST
jgi:hypothetical protein